MNQAIIEELKTDMASYQKKSPAVLLNRKSTVESAFAKKKLGYTSFRMNSPAFLLDIWRFNTTKEYSEVVDSVLELAKGRCVDLGNTIGTMARALEGSKKVKKAEYFDLNKENAEFAKFMFKRHGENITVHKSIGSIVAQKKYDTFVLINVLETMTNPEDFLVTLFNRLRKNGRIIITYDFEKEASLICFKHWENYEEMEVYMDAIGFKKGKDLPGIFEFWRPN